jgi:hypothetical protein
VCVCECVCVYVCVCVQWARLGGGGGISLWGAGVIGRLDLITHWKKKENR